MLAIVSLLGLLFLKLFIGRNIATICILLDPTVLVNSFLSDVLALLLSFEVRVFVCALSRDLHVFFIFFLR